MKKTIVIAQKNTLVALVFLLSIQISIAQSVGIGTANPNPSARLEVNSTTQGILIPSLTSTQRSGISNPATGLLVFQTDGTPGFYYYTGVSWINLTNGYQPNNQGMAVSSSYGITSTVAGNGSHGDVDGDAMAASFHFAMGVAVSASGLIYVADAGNNKIRKINTLANGTMEVSTFAGNGSRGAANGPGTAAAFYEPQGVAVDASGNIYVADRNNANIRKITPAGMVSTFAGTSSRGSIDGPGNTASFREPEAVAVDASGNVYVADHANHKIRKISPGGNVSTLAGTGFPGSVDGNVTIASFNYPKGVAVDASGNVYVSDNGNNKIRKISSNGEVSTLAGSGVPGSVDGTGTSASFYYPAGVAVDALGNVYVADVFNNKIRKINPAGVVTTLAGSGLAGDADGAGTEASFEHCFSVAVDASGNIYVADTGNNKIRKIIAH